MSRSLAPLSLLLVFAAGCHHGNVRALPTLPASHGHLSWALHDYLELPTRLGPTNVTSIGEPNVVVEPTQAPTVFEEAVQVLKGKPTPEEVRQAAADLEGACDAPYQAACDFLRAQTQPPKKLEGTLPQYPPEAIQAKAFAMVVLRCRLGVDGRFRACEVLEMAPYGFTEAVIESVKGSRYRPVMLAGHPIEVTYTFNALMRGGREELTPEKKLQWLRMRVERFPESSTAWFELAKLLAKQAPTDPGYVVALQHLNKLTPRSWWPANELAWTLVQTGRYAEAAPLVKRALQEAPLNPYVLETSAATLSGLGRCEEAIAEQQRAVQGLPPAWPTPERERFQSALREYTQRCPPAAAPQQP